MARSDEAVLERIEFERRVAETGIDKHLSPTALMLAFLALGPRMWKDREAS